MTISSSDVVRIACRECEEIEVCPSMLSDEYEARQTEDSASDAMKEAETKNSTK